VSKHLRDYGHIFLGTNDFEQDFMKIHDLIVSEHLAESSQTVFVVSNGWMFIVDSLFKTI